MKTNERMIYGLAYTDCFGNKWYVVGKAVQRDFGPYRGWLFEPQYMTLDRPFQLRENMNPNQFFNWEEICQPTGIALALTDQ